MIFVTKRMKGTTKMKTLMMMGCALALVSGAFAQEAAPAVADKAAARIERQAKMAGMTVEEFKALSPAERKAKLAERRGKAKAKGKKAVAAAAEAPAAVAEAAAKAADETAEKAKDAAAPAAAAADAAKAKKEAREAKAAKRLGMSVEDYRKLTPAERKAKLAELKKNK